MLGVSNSYHVVRNFPEGYPFYKKVVANVIFFFTGIVVKPRKNLLTGKDLVKARLVLRRGDVVLVGNLRTFLHSLMRDPVTHSALYVGRKRFIHSMADGVQFMGLRELFRNYDTLVILRVPKSVFGRKRIIRGALSFALSQFGKPYDFDFKCGEKSFFCTALVNESFKSGGYKTGLSTVKRRANEFVHSSVDALRPVNFLNGRFRIVFLSHNLVFENKKLTISVKDSP